MNEPVTGTFFLDDLDSDQSQTGRGRVPSGRVKTEARAEAASLGSHRPLAGDLETGRRQTSRQTRSRAAWAIVITGIGLFMASLDNLVVTTALPVIREHLHAGLSGLEWTVNAYTLTFAVLLLSAAALGERFGRRRIFVLGIALFTAASAVAALAPSITVLVMARAIQGAGGAMIMPLSLTLLSAAVPPQRRNVALGILGCHRRSRGGYRPAGWGGDHERMVVAVHLLAQCAYRRGVGPAGLVEVGGVSWGRPAWTWWV